ncbi:GlxA family transcriptional regulator [Aliisedimentitalea scapharcae]|uniref:GlxA family transcriptional regulator n=1 Tax=Aliisedimentitalea scapharcae TaxID=1524259 RepID=A0ABZ2XQG8_9RHOB|nr:GlxA family transcriptional regulator [Rhodobacteraceae bacterium M382]
MTKVMQMVQDLAQPVFPVAHRRFVFLLLPSFSPLDLASAISALDGANQYDGNQRYSWRTVHEGGALARSVFGVTVAVDGSLDPVERTDTIFVCGGAGQIADSSPGVLAWLRQAARKGCQIGAVGGGVFALAKAGLLDNRPVSTHWSLLHVAAETWPDLEISRSLFAIDETRFTCAGGAATLDMMLQLIARHHGMETATAVSDRLVCSAPRGASHEQTLADHCRTGVRHEKLSAALAVMRGELEAPLRPSDIARQVGLSTRQLERLFSKYLNVTPKVFHTRLRLENARSMLRQTNMKIIEVGLANGFSSQSHFSRVYRRHFGFSPQAERGFDPH